MFGGFQNNGIAVTGGYTPELMAIIARAVAMGYELPTRKNLDLMNELMIGLKAASVTGDLNAYSRINIYGTNIARIGTVTGDLGFDGIWWNNPDNSVTGIGNLNKVIRQGYSRQTGANYIDSNHNAANDNNITGNDLLVMYHFENEINGGGSDRRYGMQGGTDATRIFLLRGDSFRFMQYGSGTVLSVSSGFTGRQTYICALEVTQRAFYRNNVLIQSLSGAFLTKPNLNFFELASNAGGTPVNFDHQDAISAVIIGRHTLINRTLCYNALINYFEKLSQLR